MGLTLYNSLAKALEPFDVPKDRAVTMYTCGPTVYGRPHIGNYSSFLMADLLRRWLEVSGWRVTHVKNITDVGHLVRDSDTGEDKIEKQAREEFGGVSHESVLQVARKYEAMYLEDERTLNLLEPAHRPRATEYIGQMTAMVEDLLRTGHAYVIADGIYFDVTSETPTPYGALSGNTLENVAAGARVGVNEGKRHPADFALWKFCVGPNEHHALRWLSPVGPAGETYPEGFPGWHIECSAMSRALLGDQIDLHTGGEDNIFPHHECEIAQSESVTGKKPFVRLWLHKRRIDLEGEKMSKSLGNVLNIPDIIAKGYDAMDVRYYLLSVHYRTNLKFSWKGMDDAKKERHKIMEWMSAVSDHAMKKGIKFSFSKTDVSQWVLASENDDKMFLKQFREVMNEDLNTAAARAEIFGTSTFFYKHESKLSDDDVLSLLRYIEVIRQTFGCFDPVAKADLPSEVQSLVDARAAARAQKNFAESDRLRGEIATLGYEVKDTSEGQKVTKL